MNGYLEFQKESAWDTMKKVMEPYEDTTKNFMDFFRDNLSQEDLEFFNIDAEELLEKLERLDIETNFESFDGHLAISFYFEYYQIPFETIFDLISYIFKDEKILVETYNVEKDYRDFYIFEDGDHEFYSGDWLEFDPADYEEDWPHATDEYIPISFVNIDIDIDVEDYSNSVAIWTSFSPFVSYILRPYEEPEKEIID